MPELIAMGGVNEIDMILARGGDLIPVELKHKRPRLNDVQKLVAVARRTNKLRPTNLEAWLIHTFRPDDPKAWREEKVYGKQCIPDFASCTFLTISYPNSPLLNRTVTSSQDYGNSFPMVRG